MSEKILLVHGPLESSGINFLTTHLCRTPEERKKASVLFNAEENIRSLSYVFRAKGFKIVYSGWTDDQAWLNANNELFDACCISNQEDIPDSVEFQGRLIQNNKEKLYFSIYQGLRVIEEKFRDCTVVRLRSDVAVDVNEIDKMVQTASTYPNSILVEFANPENVLFVPDFITISGLQTHLKLYGNLARLSRESGGHHISSHIDHGIEFLSMKERGDLSHVICMSRNVHDSMVWRGLPRYYANYEKDLSEKLFFNCLVNYPSDMNSAEVLESINPEVTGRLGEIAARAIAA